MSSLKGADFTGADLSAKEFAFVSLEQACFDNAKLSATGFRHVDLTNASFRGARLDHATFHLVRAGGVDFHDAAAVDVHWERCSLVGSRFSSANLCRARFVSSDLASACFDHSDLTLGSLAWSRLDGAAFSGTNFDQVETLGISAGDVDFTKARNFAYCREIVLEVLKTGLDRELETMKWLGAIWQLRDWCYPAWVELLMDEPQQLAKAAKIFKQYPASGCYEALQGALKNLESSERIRPEHRRNTSAGRSAGPGVSDPFPSGTRLPDSSLR